MDSELNQNQLEVGCYELLVLFDSHGNLDYFLFLFAGRKLGFWCNNQHHGLDYRQKAVKC